MQDCNIIPIGKDGYYHPENEAQIIELVKCAYKNNLQVRCRGSVHSVADSIYTDPGEGDAPVPNRVSQEIPPQGPNINIMFDKYIKLEWIDEENGICETEAGIHLGVDPLDPTDTSTEADSFLYQIAKKGWTINDLGGITHQTVSGFQMMGCAGGTTMYSLEDNYLAFRVIDGTGNVRWIEKGDYEYGAVGVSFGLLGIISKIRYKLNPDFNIYGQQFITPTKFEKCPVDLFGNGRDGKPSFQEYLEKTPYTRMLWWPQKGVERVVFWEAVRGKQMPAFDPIPFKNFANTYPMTMVEQILASVLFTTLGNKGFFKTWGKLQKSFGRFRHNLITYWSAKWPSFLANLVATLITIIIWIICLPLVLIFSIFKFILWALYAPVINLLQPLTKKGKAETFMTPMRISLPMDNEADDILMGTEFTEIWIPIDRSQEVMDLLNKLYKEKGRAATGTYSNEIYAGIASEFWMSPSYGTDVIRVDIFWYSGNEGDPSVKGGYYEQFWELFVKHDIPFRLHWGKFLPNYDYKRWADYLRSQTPKWDEFMALREKQDPGNVFFTSYWRKHLLGEVKS